MKLSEWMKSVFRRRSSQIRMSPHLAESKIQFGDTVRVLFDASTESRALNGRIGTVFGQTTPSQTHVEVIGASAKDYAINVSFEGVDQTFWFAEELLELLDHGEGMEIRIPGVDKRFVRDRSGRWRELP
jgi:hypothetical protein